MPHHGSASVDEFGRGAEQAGDDRVELVVHSGSCGSGPLDLQDYGAIGNVMHAEEIVAKWPVVHQVAEVIPVKYRNIPSTAIDFADWKALVALCLQLPREHPGLAGIVIGFSLTVVHLIGIPLTGTSVNPARSLGPALVLGGTALSQVWLFIVAPLLGGILAAGIWMLLIAERPEQAAAGQVLSSDIVA